MSISLAIKFKLAEVLEENNITKNALAREAKIRPNLVYEMCNNETKRIELETFNKVMTTLNELAGEGKKIKIEDIMEFIE
ncbi:hypothetical protein GCM10023310_08170 [Paenibacillus vulneris]|uniref:Helix-turn-helix domain-containing protein n=1 Tax=Paenibacillus vulneris TaxID=1133364 RepID=A0ABW3UNW1_9BACL